MQRFKMYLVFSSRQSFYFQVYLLLDINVLFKRFLFIILTDCYVDIKAGLKCSKAMKLSPKTIQEIKINYSNTKSFQSLKRLKYFEVNRVLSNLLIFIFLTLWLKCWSSITSFFSFIWKQLDIDDAAFVDLKHQLKKRRNYFLVN